MTYTSGYPVSPLLRSGDVQTAAGAVGFGTEGSGTFDWSTASWYIYYLPRDCFYLVVYVFYLPAWDEDLKKA
jgi:hypothetical protein